jgi:hypothetical protein
MRIPLCSSGIVASAGRSINCYRPHAFDREIVDLHNEYQ